MSNRHECHILFDEARYNARRTRAMDDLVRRFISEPMTRDEFVQKWHETVPDPYELRKVDADA